MVEDWVGVFGLADACHSGGRIGRRIGEKGMGCDKMADS